MNANHDEPFRLVNPPAKLKPWKPAAEAMRQKTLLAGLDCKPGQLDLFATDGEENAQAKRYDALALLFYQAEQPEGERRYDRLADEARGNG